MGVFPGWPGGGFDFSFDEAGPIFGGMIAADVNGVPRSGVLPSSDVLVSASTGWNVSVAPFVAVRTRDRKVLIGGQDTPSILPISAAPASNSRIDLIWALPSDVDGGDLPTDVVFVRTGTVAASPIAPVPPVPEGIPLATVLVSAGMGSAAAATYTQTFKYTVMSGGVLPVRNLSDLNSFVASSGSFAYRIDNNRMYVRKSNSWVSLENSQELITATTDHFTAASGWSISSVSGYRQGMMAELRLLVTRTGAAITVGTTGDVANSTFATMTTVGAELFQPYVNFTALYVGSVGRVAAGYIGATSLIISAVAPGGNIATNESFAIQTASYRCLSET